MKAATSGYTLHPTRVFTATKNQLLISCSQANQLQFLLRTQHNDRPASEMKRVRPEPGNGAPPHTKPVLLVPPSTGLIAQLRRASDSLLAQSSAKKPDYRTKLLAYSRFDSYKLNGEDSQLHWEALTHRSHRHVKLLQARDRIHSVDSAWVSHTRYTTRFAMLWVPHNLDTHQGMVYGDDDRPYLLPYRPRHGPSC